jgi:transposase
MARAYSIDLRKRVLGVVAGGVSRRGAAERFAVSASTAVRWKKQELATGNVTPKSQGGDRRSGKIETHADWLIAYVKKHHDATLEEIRAALKTEKDLKVSVSMLWRFYDRHAITYKKSRPTLPSRNGRIL